MPAGCFDPRWLSAVLLALVCFVCNAADRPFRVERQGELLDLYDVKTGELIVDRVRDVVWMDDYWRFIRDGRHGIIDTAGRVVAPAEYDEIDRSEQSPVYIVARDGRYGVIGQDGRERVPLEYEKIGERRGQGPWIVERDGKEGLMDPADQHLLLPAHYESIALHDAFALVTNPETGTGPRYQVFDLHGRLVPGAESGAEIEGWGDDRLILDADRVIGIDGRMIVAPGSYASIRRASEARAIVFDEGRDKAGVIDRDGRVVVPPEWDYIEPLNGNAHGWMRVVAGGMPHAGGKVGVIDADGRLILKPRWEGVDLHDGRNGVSFFQVERDGKVWFLDLDDKPLHEAPFDTVRPVDREGGYLVEQGGKIGLCVNVAEERCPIPVEYDRLMEFDQAPSGLWIAQKDGRLGVLQETDGHVVVPLDYDFLQMSPESTGLPPPDGSIDEVTVVARRGSLNGTLLLRTDAQSGWRLVGEDLDRRPPDWQAQEAQASCAAVPAFNQAEAASGLQALMQRWREGLPERKNTAFGMPWPALAGSVANHSRAQHFIDALFLKPWELVADPRNEDVHELGEIFASMLESAVPVRSGGRYPETSAEFADICAEVWYLHIPALDQATENPLPGDYTLPPAGVFKRDVYPFITIARTPEGLRLAGVSRELVQVMNWYYAGLPAASEVDATAPE